MYVSPDLILRKPRFQDWQDLYRNLWSREESARYMLWDVTRSPEDAMARMERTIAFQAVHQAWIVEEKASGQAIGFAGMQQVSPAVWEDIGIAIGPEFVGRGYGKQIIGVLTDIAFQEFGAEIFVGTCRSQNIPSRALMLSQGFRYTHSEARTDPRNGTPYTLEFYELSAK